MWAGNVAMIWGIRLLKWPSEQQQQEMQAGRGRGGGTTLSGRQALFLTSAAYKLKYFGCAMCVLRSEKSATYVQSINFPLFMLTAHKKKKTQQQGTKEPKDQKGPTPAVAAR